MGSIHWYFCAVCETPVSDDTGYHYVDSKYYCFDHLTDGLQRKMLAQFVSTVIN